MTAAARGQRLVDVWRRVTPDGRPEGSRARVASAPMTAALPDSVIPADFDPRRRARALYWQGWRIARIAEEIDEKVTTVHSWKRRDKWDDYDPVQRVEATLEARLIQLVTKPDKEGRDYKEIDLLGRQIERLARVKKYSKDGNEADLNPKVENRNKGPKRAPTRNAISEEQQEKLVDAFMEGLFPYQKHWYRAGLQETENNA